MTSAMTCQPNRANIPRSSASPPHSPLTRCPLGASRHSSGHAMHEKVRWLPKPARVAQSHFPPYLRIISLFTCVVLHGCVASLPPASHFIDLEYRWVAALQSHDTVVLADLLDDSFIDSTFRGAIRTREDVLKGPPAAPSYRSVRLDDMVVRPYGRDTVIVTGVNVLQGATPDDTARVRFTDVFVKRKGSWRAVSAQETLQSAP